MKFITDLSELDPNGTYTYADYLTWRFEQSVELIKGKIFYEESGVQEYWVVYPSEKTLLQFILNEQEKYVIKSVFAEDKVFNAHIFHQLSIDLAEVFAE